MSLVRSLRFIFSAAFLHCSVWADDIPEFHPAPKPWPAEWGSHRAIVHVDESAAAARVLIPWRRRDTAPEKKSVIVVALKDSKSVAHAAALHVTADSGEVIFTPTAGPGDYAVCYLPVKVSGGAFPKSQYLAPDLKEQAWAAAVKNPATAHVRDWEAITAQDAFTAMEIIATAAETEAVQKRFAGAPFATFVEDREHVVRMFDHLPYRWTQPHNVVLQAQPGEHCIFQLAVWAHRGAVQKLSLETAGLSLDTAHHIGAPAFTCYNTHGVDWNGAPTSPVVNVPAGRIQPLWCGVTIPRDAKPGLYTGEATLVDSTLARVRVPFALEVAGHVLPDSGISKPQSLAKLQWLNSTAGLGDAPTLGYTPVELQGRVLRVLGREIELGDDGLPKRITSFFNSAVTKIGADRLELLAAPIRFFAAGEERASANSTGNLTFVEKSPTRVTWISTTLGGAMTIHGALEFDGSLHYRVELAPGRSNADIHLEIPRTAATTAYVVGMGQEAGTSKAFDWKWDVANKNQDSVWLGAVNGGLRLQLRGENYERPGVNIHYQRRPLNAPPAWWNEGRGGVSFTPGTENQPARLVAFSGPHESAKAPLHFDFDLLITPFHPLHTTEQWSDRYYHTSAVPGDVGAYLDKARAAGANVVNVHQGNSLNPYINYPFLTADRLRAFADAAHQRGLRAKYYYTVRELSNWAPELFAFRSMDNEILLHGSGGGHPWLEEHLGGDYWQAWYEPRARDVSLLTAPMSRLHNFYLEGLRWLVENAGCDGIYLDDIAYDRAIMLRARRVLDQYCPRPALIDLHSWNEFHKGGAYAQCVNLFMDSLPFVDRLWFGEGHHYSGPPAEHFLVEISGVPFGLMGEMLEGGGNPWLGLVHGCTGRLGWQGDPRVVWKGWDDFGVADAEFIGWWAGKDCPVQTGDNAVKATVWKKKGRTLLALGNFDAADRRVKLTVDWTALGLSPEKTKFYAPALPPLQPREAVYSTTDSLLVAGHKGVLLWLDETPRQANTATAAAPADTVLREETFATVPPPGWKADLSTKIPAGAIRADSGLVLNIPANIHAWYESPLPHGTTGVSTSVWQDGKDEAQQWGPGLALLWSGGDTLKVNCRRDGRLGISYNGKESFPTSLAERAEVTLTLRWDDREVRVIAGGPAMQGLDQIIATLPRTQFRGDPTLVRLGKMPADATTKDHSDPGLPGFTRFTWLRFLGPGAAPAAPR